MQRRQFLAATSALALAACRQSAPDLPGGFTGIDMARGHQLRERLAQGLALEPTQQQRTQVLVLGGGIAGLAAARALRLGGVEDFALLELEDQAGGNSRGTQVGGLACPMGAHYLPLPGAPMIAKL